VFEKKLLAYTEKMKQEDCIRNCGIRNEILSIRYIYP
jgi:hypothetical protein